jgi:hypothetical protein
MSNTSALIARAKAIAAFSPASSADGNGKLAVVESICSHPAEIAASIRALPWGE